MPTSTVNTPIALEARDLLPETWEALAKADTFGPAALARRHNRIVSKIFGSVLDDAEQEAYEALDGRIIEYAGKRLALAIVDPGIEYWSKQVLSLGVWDRENSSYKDRADDLRKLRAQWIVDLAELLEEIEPELPLIPGRAKSSPQVFQAGENLVHVTPNPLDIPTKWNPAEGPIVR